VALWSAAGASAVPWIAIVVLATGLAPLLWHATHAGAARIVALTSLYMLWHEAFGALLPEVAPPPFALELFAAACFAGIYFLQFWLTQRASSPLARALYPWAYAGFYADERFTRWALGLWPRAMRRRTTPAREPLRIEETP
jgi:NAD(P)H-quinone oxidoreductase subunit 5